MRKHWRLFCNYADAPNPELDHWSEDSWLAVTPQQIIDDFNNTLRPGERKRVLLFAWPLSDTKGKLHTWYKSKPVTIVKGGQVYDEYTCSVCKAKGKRFGLSEVVTPDRKNQINCKG